MKDGTHQLFRNALRYISGLAFVGCLYAFSPNKAYWDVYAFGLVAGALGGLGASARIRNHCGVCRRNGDDGCQGQLVEQGKAKALGVVHEETTASGLQRLARQKEAQEEQTKEADSSS